MATSGKEFVGRWRIVEWTPLPDQDLQQWLVKKDTHLSIREKNGQFEVRWQDHNRGDCTIVPSLRFLNGELVGEDSRLQIANNPSFRPRVRPGVAFEADTARPTLIVSLARGIITGNPGTFIAEGPPSGDPEG